MPKNIVPLTFLVIKNAKPKEKAYKMSDGGGLYLEITPKGSKLWRMKFKQPASGKENRLSFGIYPEVSLEQARQRRDEARRLLVQGIDPSEEREAQKTRKREESENTLEKIARAWHQNNLPGWKAGTAKDILHRLEQDIFPTLGNLPIRTIKHRQLIDALRKIEERGACEIAKRLKANCVRIWSYAIQHELADKNIAIDMTDVLKPTKKGRFAAIATDELPEFLNAMDTNDARMFPTTRIALRLMMLLFLRTSELIETPWNEINLETGKWVIPWHRMKRGKLTINPDRTDHNVPLSRQALDLLRELHTLTGGNKWLFPNKKDHTKPMSNGAILMALKRMGYQGRMTGHGFRALAMSTIKERLEYRHEVVDRQLAHAHEKKQNGTYDRAPFLTERGKMMQDWADYLDELPR